MCRSSILTQNRSGNAQMIAQGVKPFERFCPNPERACAKTKRYKLAILSTNVRHVTSSRSRSRTTSSTCPSGTEGSYSLPLDIGLLGRLAETPSTESGRLHYMVLIKAGDIAFEIVFAHPDRMIYRNRGYRIPNLSCMSRHL